MTCMTRNSRESTGKLLYYIAVQHALSHRSQTGTAKDAIVNPIDERTYAYASSCHSKT